MENASKALIMAGGVLISIIIISMLMLMANSLTSYQQTSVQTQREAEIFKFNQQYEGYNRNGVRGNELYSLISKVIDYNKKRTTIGEPGDSEGFEPMEISFNLKGNNKDLTKDDTNRIFTEPNIYTFNTSARSDALREKTIEKISDLTKDDIENTVEHTKFRVTEASLDRLVTGYDNIFISAEEYNGKSIEDKVKIFWNFNSSLGADFFTIKGGIDEDDLDRLWNLIDEDSDIREKVNTYYEYVQFKRAIFDCEPDSVKYSTTGRLIKMNFIFTGKFN